MNYKCNEHYSSKGGRREEQVEAYRNPTITVKELRIMTDTVNSYKQFTRFNNDVLKTLDEINAHTSFNVTYDKIKKGVQLILLSFISRRNQSHEMTSTNWKNKTYLFAG